MTPTPSSAPHTPVPSADDLELDLRALAANEGLEVAALTPGLHGSMWVTFRGAQDQQVARAAKALGLVRRHGFQVKLTSGGELLVVGSRDRAQP